MNGSLLSASTYQGSLMLGLRNEELACVFVEHPAEDNTLLFYLRSRSFHIVWSLKKMARFVCKRLNPEVVPKQRPSQP